MASLVIKSAGLRSRVIELNLGANRLGRAPENDVQIDDPAVAPRHCDLVLSDDGVMARDCGSAQGTFVDGRRIKEAKLKAGQTLRLGEVALLVENTEVNIAIPRFTFPQPSAAGAPSEGGLFCARHPEAPATHRCTRCRKAFCSACVRRVRSRDGRVAVACPHCKRPCEALCSRHCGERATLQCTRCRKLFCDACVRKLRRTGGKVLKLCGRCTRECVLICPRHPEVRAIFRCTHCGVAWCYACARFRRRRTGPPVRVCPICRHACQLFCPRHPEERATHHCARCQELLCPACVQVLRGRGGQLLTFCALCSEPCVPVKEQPLDKKPLLARLQATVQTALRRKRKRAKPGRSARPGHHSSNPANP